MSCAGRRHCYPGGMFWFRRRTFVGSNRVFNAWSRSNASSPICLRRTRSATSLAERKSVTVGLHVVGEPFARVRAAFGSRELTEELIARIDSVNPSVRDAVQRPAHALPDACVRRRGLFQCLL
jgi:hypothetical protein